MEFSGNTDPFAEICVHGRWQNGKHHSIPHKIALLFIVNFYNQLNIEKMLSRSYLPADNRISLSFLTSGNYRRAYTEHSFVRTVDGKSETTIIF
jgi:hypothetical protein